MIVSLGKYLIDPNPNIFEIYGISQMNKNNGFLAKRNDTKIYREDYEKLKELINSINKGTNVNVKESFNNVPLYQLSESLILVWPRNQTIPKELQDELLNLVTGLVYNK